MLFFLWFNEKLFFEIFYRLFLRVFGDFGRIIAVVCDGRGVFALWEFFAYFCGFLLFKETFLFEKEEDTDARACNYKSLCP